MWHEINLWVAVPVALTFAYVIYGFIKDTRR